jgi:excisionase family DNA binding protein
MVTCPGRDTWPSGALRVSPLLHVEGVGQLLGVSVRSVHELTRRREIPFRRIAGTRRCLFVEAEVLAWVDSGGTLPLEVTESERGGVVVRPKAPA